MPHRKESNAAKFLKSPATKVPASLGDDDEFEDKYDFKEDDSDIQ